MKQIAPWIEAFLTSLFEHLPEGLAICDADQRLLRANPAFCSLFGYSEEEMAGRDLDDIVSGGSRRYGEAQSYTDQVLAGQTVQIETTRYRRDGTALEVLALGLPIVDGGAVVGVLALYRDVSERVQSRRLLEAAKAHLEATLNSIGDAVITTDTEGRVTSLNGAAQSLTGKTEALALGRAVEEVVTLRDGAGGGPLENPLRRALREQAVIGLDEGALLVDSRGALHDVADSAAPIVTDEGELAGAVMVLRDVTESRRRAREIEASRSQYRDLIANLPDRILRFDGSGRCRFAGPGAEAALGLAPGSLEGRSLGEAGVDEAFCRDWEAFLGRSGRDGGGQEESFVLPGATTRRYSCRAVAETGGGTLVICRDVTEGRRLERNYRLLFESMLDGFALHEMVYDDRGEPADYRFLDANPAFFSLTGLTEEVLGKTLLEALPDSDRFWIDTYGDVVRTGRPASFIRFDPVLAKTFEIVAYRTEAGRFVTLFRDISELERARKQTDHLNRVLRSIRGINRLIVAERDRSRLLRSVCDLFVDERGYLLAWIALFDACDGLTTFASSGGEIESIPAITLIRDGFLPPCSAEVLAGRGFAQIEGIQSCCSDCPACSARTEKTLLLSRIEHQDRTYGVLGLTLPDGVAADEEELDLFREVSGDVAFALSLIEADEARERDREALAASYLKIRQAQEGTIAVLSKAVETRDPYTAGHQERAARLARALAGRLGLSEAETEAVFFAARLHDIGKIRVPSEILNKPGRLSELEFAIVREHADAGWTILKDIDFPWPVAEIVRQHHERLDGSGYPRGLKGEEIGRAARIIAVADVVEAMTSHRPYRPAPGLATALEEVEAHRGSRYDGKVVDACLDLFRQGFRFDEDGLI